MQDQLVASAASSGSNITNPCSFIILQGKRAGQPCGRRATKSDGKGKQLCVTHFRMSSIPGNSTTTEEKTALIQLPELGERKDKKRKKPKVKLPSSSSSDDEEYEYVKVPKKKNKVKEQPSKAASFDYESLWESNVLNGLHSIIGLK